jgi:hypothetical protein
MAAVLKGAIRYMQTLEQPTAVTLFTDSLVVYHTLVKGTGVTLRRSLILQQLYARLYQIKTQAGHGLVVRWVSSDENLADLLSRGVHPAKTWSARL